MITNREIEYRDLLNSRLLENRYKLEDLIENYASLTYAYLSRVGKLDATIDDFCRNVPAIRPQIAAQFLKSLLYDSDVTVSVLARYELSQHAIEEGRTVYERLTWEYQPENLIEALLTKGKLPTKGKEPITMVLSSVAA